MEDKINEINQLIQEYKQELESLINDIEKELNDNNPDIKKLKENLILKLIQE